LSSKSSYRQAALIGVLIGLALLTKMTAIVYLFAIAGVMTGHVLKRSLSLPTAGLHLLLIIGLAAVLFAPWLLRNLQVYGHIYPEEVANVPETWRSMSEAFTVTLQKINHTFWSASGIRNRTSFLPQAGVYLTYLALGGLLYGLFAKTKPLPDYLSGARGIFIGGTAFAIVINLVLALRFGMLYNQGQGRFLFPLLIPLAILLALGLKSINPTKYLKYGHIHTMGFFIIYVLPFTSYSLCSFPGSWVKWLYSNLS
jgi:hypothetical protein